VGDRRNDGELRAVAVQEDWGTEGDRDDGLDEQDEALEGWEQDELDEDEDEGETDDEDEEEDEDYDDGEEEDENEDGDDEDDDDEDEDEDYDDEDGEEVDDELDLSFAIPDGCRIEVAPRNEVNGWTDGETVTITSRALEELPEGALAALVAHELAHVQMRHVQHNRALAEAVVESLAGVWRETGAGFGKKVVTTVAAAGASFVGSRLYRKLQELSADAGALDLLRKGGYTAADARELEQRLEGEGGLLSSHPSQETRLRWLDALEDE